MRVKNMMRGLVIMATKSQRERLKSRVGGAETKRSLSIMKSSAACIAILLPGYTIFLLGISDYQRHTVTH